jgi:dipeptidase
MRRLVVLLLGLIVSITSFACTNFIVGKNASADGSVLVSYAADNYGMFGCLYKRNATKHNADEMREVYNWDTNKFLGKIPEASQTYNVVGNINENQVAIAETTFGGREELVDTTGSMDYGSMIYIALERSRNAREAIKIMTSLADTYGYNSEGETFTIADKNEAWIMEMVGKGNIEKGAVWVAIRVPDDCVCAHANQSRIHKFNMKDKDNVMYAKDVVKFARKQGYFNGKDEDFDFANAYCPATFSGLRFCEARVWSFFNRWANEDMNQYLTYASGQDLNAKPMPLFVKPKRKLSVADVITSMRDHYEGTPFDTTTDIGSGVYCAPYRPSPLTWKCEGKEYFNERPASTQQSAFVFVAQLRSNMPDAIGGVLWFGNDDANMVAFTPMYCCMTKAPECFSAQTADDVTFSWKSAFWVCNWVSNMVYPRYSMMFEDVRKMRDKLESSYFEKQQQIESQAKQLYSSDNNKAIALLTNYSDSIAMSMLAQWKNLGEFLVVKYNDQVIKPESEGKFLRNKEGLGETVKRPGFPDAYRKTIIKETGNKYLVPSN